MLWCNTTRSHFAIYRLYFWNLIMTLIQWHKFCDAAVILFNTSFPGTTFPGRRIIKRVSVSPSERGGGDHSDLFEFMLHWHQQPQSVMSVKEGKHAELHIRARPNIWKCVFVEGYRLVCVGITVWACKCHYDWVNNKLCKYRYWRFLSDTQQRWNIRFN